MAGRGRPKKNPNPDDTHSTESDDSETQESPTDPKTSTPDNNNGTQLPEIDLSQFDNIAKGETSFNIESLDSPYTPNYDSILSEPAIESELSKNQKVNVLKDVTKKQKVEYRCGYCEFQRKTRKSVEMHSKKTHKDQEVKVLEVGVEATKKSPYIEIIAYDWSKELFGWFGEFIADKRGDHWKFTEKNHSMITKPGHRFLNRCLARFLSEASGDAIAFAFGMFMYCCVNIRKDKKLKRIEEGTEEPEQKKGTKKDTKEESDIPFIPTSFQRPTLSVAG